MTQIHKPVDELLTEILTAAIRAADGPVARALVLDQIAERAVTVIAHDPAVDERERSSMRSLLDAADEHCERMGAFTPHT